MACSRASFTLYWFKVLQQYGRTEFNNLSLYIYFQSNTTHRAQCHAQRIRRSSRKLLPSFYQTVVCTVGDVKDTGGKCTVHLTVNGAGFAQREPHTDATLVENQNHEFHMTFRGKINVNVERSMPAPWRHIEEEAIWLNKVLNSALDKG